MQYVLAPSETSIQKVFDLSQPVGEGGLEIGGCMYVSITMYIYIIHIRVYIYTHLCTCIHTYVYIHIYIYIMCTRLVVHVLSYIHRSRSSGSFFRIQVHRIYVYLVYTSL